MKKKNEDIDRQVEILERIAAHPGDRGALASFAEHDALPVAQLLEELRRLRDQGTQAAQGTLRLIVEGYSEDSAKAAFADALNKALCHMSQLHDTCITLLGLMHLPQGGHRATLEVRLMPMTQNHTLHVQGADVEIRRERDHEFRRRKMYEEAHLRALVHDHFLSNAGSAPDVPDFFLINIQDADLLNDMIEKEFFKAGRKIGVDGSEPTPIVVQVRRPQPEAKAG